jgi:hypothetical protein
MGDHTKSDNDLVERVFDVALQGTDGNPNARRDALWVASITLLADVPRRQ